MQPDARTWQAYAVVLGSGLSDLAAALLHVDPIPFSHIDGMPASGVAGAPQEPSTPAMSG